MLFSSKIIGIKISFLWRQDISNEKSYKNETPLVKIAKTPNFRTKFLIKKTYQTQISFTLE